MPIDDYEYKDTPHWLVVNEGSEPKDKFGLSPTGQMPWQTHREISVLLNGGRLRVDFAVDTNFSRSQTGDNGIIVAETLSYRVLETLPTASQVEKAKDGLKAVAEELG